MGVVAATLIAAIAGTLANSAVQHFAGAATFAQTARRWGRYAVAIACATILPVSLSLLPPVPAIAISLIVLALAPSILARTVFGSDVGWGRLVAVNTVFACVTCAAYFIVL